MMQRHDWRLTRLKYVTECNANVLPESTAGDYHFVYVDIGNVSQGHIAIPQDLTSFADAPSRARRVASAGDTVISTVRTYLRAVATVPDCNAPLVFSTGFAVLHPRPEVYPRFLSYYLQGDEFVDRVVSHSTGVSYPAITATELSGFSLRLPPHDEQRTIADFLDRETAQIDVLIAKQEQLIATLLERRTSAIDRTLSRLSQYSKTRLKHVAVIQTGVTLGGEGDIDCPAWPYLRVANVQTGYIDLSEIKTVRLTREAARSSTLHPGDVLMTEGGDIDKLGRGALWRGEVSPMLHQNHVFAVRPSRQLLPEFLVYWLDGAVARQYFRDTARKTTNLASTNKFTLGNLPVCCPSRGEQQDTVDQLGRLAAQVDDLIVKAETFIRLSRERRAALITAAVTGQLNVRERVS